LVESNNVKKAIKVIDDLLKAEIGDPERLKSIKEKLEKKIRVTADEVDYLQEQMKKLDESEPEESKPEEPKEEPKHEQPTKKTPSEKPPKVKVSTSMPGKKPIIVGVLGGVAILFLIFAAGEYFTTAPISESVAVESVDTTKAVEITEELEEPVIVPEVPRLSEVITPEPDNRPIPILDSLFAPTYIERLENARTLAEFESAIEEGDLKLGELTTTKCSEWLDEYALHDADPIEYRKNWQGTIWEYTEYIPVLSYKFIWFQCNLEYQ